LLDRDGRSMFDDHSKYKNLEYDDYQVEGLMGYFGFSSYNDLATFLNNITNNNHRCQKKK
jgi:hypothetical protein